MPKDKKMTLEKMKELSRIPEVVKPVKKSLTSALLVEKRPNPYPEELPKSKRRRTEGPAILPPPPIHSQLQPVECKDRQSLQASKWTTLSEHLRQCYVDVNVLENVANKQESASAPTQKPKKQSLGSSKDVENRRPGDGAGSQSRRDRRKSNPSRDQRRGDDVPSQAPILVSPPPPLPSRPAGNQVQSKECWLRCITPLNEPLSMVCVHPEHSGDRSMHRSCVSTFTGELEHAPDEDGKWFCPRCYQRKTGQLKKWL